MAVYLEKGRVPQPMTEVMPEPLPILQATASTSQFVRCIQVVVFVLVWMMVGWLFRLDANSYLVVGVPLVAIFQLFVRKKSLVTLWIRDAERFRLKTWGTILGLGWAILPSVMLVQSVRSPDRMSHVPEILWYLCCIVGAFGAGFSFSHFVKQTWRELGLCTLTAGLIGSGTMLLGMLARWMLMHKPIALNGAMAVTGLRSFVLYVPVCFVLEEVVFRGALDSHLFQAGDKGQWWTAIFISTLWGWWHLPITGASGILQLMELLFLLPCIHIAVGTFFSLSWRRSGNLAVPATVHAFIDAIRNMLM